MRRSRSARHSRFALLLAVFAFVNVPLGLAQDVEAEILAAVQRYVDAVNAGDPAGLARLYARRSGVGSVGDGRISSGWDSVADLLSQIFREAGAIEMSVDSPTVMALGGDAGLAFFRYRWVLGREHPQAAWGAMTLVFIRTADGWLVAHDHTSSLPPDSFGALPGATLVDSGPRSPVRRTASCRISRIVDGDTVECAGRGRIRLIGVDTPELSHAPYGAMAAQAIRALIPVGSLVEIELDVEPRDRYGRLLAYVWRDGLLVNWMLLRQGWAVMMTYPPNVQYVEWFEGAQRTARDERVGLWAIRAFSCPPEERRRGRC